jgi:hypothetical protein
MGNLSFEPEGGNGNMLTGWLSLSKQPFKSRRAQLSATSVIPGRAQREPGIHTPDRGYGFRACAKWRIPE